MGFTVPNALNRFRVDTFSTKEPETLEWIDQFPQFSTFWDIGANVGLYSVYAAKQRDCRVVAFEPSVFNLELLARNCFLNNLEERMTIIPVALSDELGSNVLKMTSTDWGGAMSTFGRNVGWDGKPIQDIFSFQTFGFSMDQAVDMHNLPVPEFIKMDVDGIEHFILQGGPRVLSEIKGILVEINDDFPDQANQSRMLLEAAGLTLREKRQGVMFGNLTSPFRNTFNQIWVRQ